MWKPLILSLVLVAGCATVPSSVAICTNTVQERNDHVAALIETPDEKVLLTGQRLIAKLDAGCAD